MKALKIDERNSFLELVPESLDDLWHLERIIEKGDLIKGRSTRKIKGGEGTKAEKIPVMVEVEVEKIEFHKDAVQLRISGPMTSMKPEEFLELGAHHAIEVGLGTKIQVKKKKLKQYQIERIKKAVSSTNKPKLLVVLLDDEQADFALVKDFGFDLKFSIRSERHGKQFKQEKEKENKYFSELLQKINDSKFDKVIIAGPGFTKEDFEKYLKEKNFKGNFFTESTNSVGITGLNELAKSGVIEKIIVDSLVAEETRLVENALIEIKRGSELIAYGIKEIEKAAESGAIKELLISDTKLLVEREEAEKLIEKLEQSKSIILVVSSQHEAGKILEGFGGMIAFLRFKVNY
ncbi:MAG: mRNA surveillance protein pelota [Candidatus Diapherotrites archaeon]